MHARWKPDREEEVEEEEDGKEKRDEDRAFYQKQLD